MVSREAHNLQTVGSIPTSATFSRFSKYIQTRLRLAQIG